MSDAAPSSAPASAPAVPASTSNAPASGPAGAAPPASSPPSDAAGGISPPPPTPKRFALKFGDRTEEVTEEQLIHRAQKAYGAEQAFREAAEVRKQQAEFEEALKDPRKAREYLKKRGADPDAYLKTWALDWHQAQEMTEEQKATVTERQRAEAAEAKLKAQEEAAAKTKFEQDEQAAHGKYVETFSAAIAKVVGADVDPSKVSPRMVQAMANWHQANLVTGAEATPEVVAQEAMETALGDGFAALDLYSPAEQVKRLGPERMAKLIKEVVRQEDERAGVGQPPPQTRPQVVNGERPRNGDGTFKPTGRAAREDASFQRFIRGGGL